MKKATEITCVCIIPPTIVFWTASYIYRQQEAVNYVYFIHCFASLCSGVEEKSLSCPLPPFKKSNEFWSRNIHWIDPLSETLCSICAFGTVDNGQSSKAKWHYTTAYISDKTNSFLIMTLGVNWSLFMYYKTIFFYKSTMNKVKTGTFFRNKTLHYQSHIGLIVFISLNKLHWVTKIRRN